MLSVKVKCQGHEVLADLFDRENNWLLRSYFYVTCNAKYFARLKRLMIYCSNVRIC
jgi:hypothetical protein